MGIFRNLFQKTRVERELDEELRVYFDMLVEANRQRGLDESEARRAAMLEIRGLDQVKESVRDVKAGALLEEFVRDVRHGARMLRKHAGFTALALITLAVGIGANTAVFSVVDNVVFRDLPYREPDRLMKICGTDTRDADCDDDFSMLEFERIRELNRVFDQVAADDGSAMHMIRSDGTTEFVGVGMVTTNWLPSLGAQPLLGRNFVPEESQTGRDLVVILTDDYWRHKFGSDPQIVGKTLTLDRNSYSVIGVLPPNVLRSYADVLKPLVTSTYADASLDLFGRLQPGVSTAQAQADLQSIGLQIEPRNRHLSVKALGKHYAPREQKVEHGLVLMLGAVGLVLLIACANVANLLLSRSAMRGRECLIRSALGAPRRRLIRQFMIESMLLFCFGGAVGIAAAYLSMDSLAALAAAGGYVPERMAVTMDARVVVISFLVTLLTGVGFGLAPALQASQVDLNRGLRDAGYSLTAGTRRTWTRRLLIVSELALSLVLLVGFGLLIRSFYRIYAESAGFDPEGVLVTGSDEGRSFTDAAAFWRTALERTHALPGVLSASVTSRPPVHRARTQRFRIEGFPEIKSEEAPEAGDILISADYFSTLGIPIVSGRAFTGQDSENSPPVVIISESVAGRYFANQDPIGKRVQLAEKTALTCCVSPGPLENVWREIVGVVGDVRQANLDDAPALTLYRPYTQIVEHDMFLMLRTASGFDAGRIARELRPLLTGIDRQKEWTQIQPMLQVIHDSESIRLRRFVLILLGTFAGLALVLAAVGVYAVTATAVAERTREMGVRIALGATRTDLFREVLSEVIGLAGAGLAIGLIISMLLTRLVSTMLFGISRVDALTYTGVTVVLTAAVLMAAYVPARRATRVDPTVALRYD